MECGVGKGRRLVPVIGGLVYRSVLVQRYNGEICLSVRMRSRLPPRAKPNGGAFALVLLVPTTTYKRTSLYDAFGPLATAA